VRRRVPDRRDADPPGTAGAVFHKHWAAKSRMHLVGNNPGERIARPTWREWKDDADRMLSELSQRPDRSQANDRRKCQLKKLPSMHVTSPGHVSPKRTATAPWRAAFGRTTRSSRRHTLPKDPMNKSEKMEYILELYSRMDRSMQWHERIKSRLKLRE